MRTEALQQLGELAQTGANKALRSYATKLLTNAAYAATAASLPKEGE